MSRRIVFWGLLSLFLAGLSLPALGAHPFVIVTDDMYSDLRAKSTSQPWSTMKSNALSRASVNLSTTEQNIDTITNVVGASALAYILDPDNKDDYIQNIKDGIYALEYNEDQGDFTASIWPWVSNWSRQIPPGNAAFNCILALDIIYDELTSSEVNTLEDKIDDVVGRITWAAWPMNRAGINGLWELYNNNISNFNSRKSDYDDALYNYLSDDGVFKEGPGYAWARMGQTEIAKTHFLDICEFTNRGSYYTDQKVINLYEWMFGSAINNRFYLNVFGDTESYLQRRSRKSAAIFRAGKFSKKAASYAKWINSGAGSDGFLLNYVLCDEALPAEKVGSSRIFEDGGAFFRDSNWGSTLALQGSLWNFKDALTDNADHPHTETNAIQLNGFRELLITNSGYNGHGNDQGGCGTKCTWDWLHNKAEASSGVMINNANHDRKDGNGMEMEWSFTSDSFDSACGDSGNAFSEGKNWRQLIQVHNQDDKRGYWVLFDQFHANNSSHQANIVLHPYTSATPTNDGGTKKELIWTIQEHRGENTYLNIFMVTEPASISFSDSILASRQSGRSLVGKYSKATYDTDGSGDATIATVLFPWDSTTYEPDITRISTSGHDGAKIDHGDNVIDYVFEGTMGNTFTYGNVQYRGVGSMWREVNGQNTFYYITKGYRFYYNYNDYKVGFYSTNNAVTVHIRETSGAISSVNGANIIFYYPNLLGVSVDDAPYSGTVNGDGSVTISVSAGAHTIEFVTDTDTISPASSSDDAEENLANGHITLTSGDYEMVMDNSVKQAIGIRFPDLAVPQGTKIQNAMIQFTSDRLSSGDTLLVFEGHDTDDAGTFSSSNHNISSRNKTSASVDWDVPIWLTGSRGTAQKTPDLSSIAQEVIDRSGWNNDNAIVFIITGEGLRGARSYDKYGGSSKADLYVEFSTHTQDKIVVAGSDDSEEANSNNWAWNGSTGLELGEDDGDNVLNVCGMRFQNLNIPQGATIASAYIQFEAKGSYSNTCNLDIYAQDIDDAPAFVDAYYNITNRTATTASVSWAPPSWTDGDRGSAQKTPNIKSVIQEIVDRGGWDPGNDLVIIIDGDGRREADAYESTSGTAPVLFVEWY